MEAETVLYFITGVVIFTFIAFCCACYCTCREMKLNTNTNTTTSPTSSTSSRVFWTGNPNTVMALYPASVRRTSQRFRQMSWRSLMQRNDRSPSISSSHPLLISSNRTCSFSDPQTSTNITVFYERRNSPAGVVSAAPLMSSLNVPGQNHIAINMPNNVLLQALGSLQTPQDLPPPYEEALRSSTVIVKDSEAEK